MAADYIPSSDADFDNWFSIFSTFCSGGGLTHGLSAAQGTAISDAYDAWHSAFQNHQTQQNAAKAATQIKNDERAEAEDMARQFARILQSVPTMTDAGRSAAGLTVADSQPTPQGSGQVESTMPPLLLLDWSQRSRVTIKFGSNPQNERNNALPPGMCGCKLWYALGGVPANEADWKFLVDDTSSPYTHVLTITEPTTIVYRAQYFDRQMRTGPFGDPVVATMTV